MRYVYRRIDPPSRATIVFAPPIGGFKGELRLTIDSLQADLAASRCDSYAVEFSGQNDAPGLFSVNRSCDELRTFLSDLSSDQPLILFGICSGALASLHASRFVPAVRAVFCWEVASRYTYGLGPVRALARRFQIRIDPETVLIPVQTEEILGDVTARVVLASSSSSAATTPSDQAHLLSRCRLGRAVVLANVDHLPRASAASLSRLSIALRRTVNATLT